MSGKTILLTPYQLKALEFIREQMTRCGFYQGNMIAAHETALLADPEKAEEGAHEPD
jgi:hypothetical protein